MCPQFVRCDTPAPVQVVPPEMHARFGRRIAIAWRHDRRATWAVLSALRCRVPPERAFVLAGMRVGAPPPIIPGFLTEHGVEAELHVLPITLAFGEALLAKAHAFGADTLVMGGYQHNPLRELILGGETRLMLGHPDLPIHIRH
jgi:nucleotide-binding universal stress UspA family protein